MILDIFRAIPLPMPLNSTSDPAAAMVWKPETPLIAISHNHKEHALLTPDQLESCKGPDDAAICQHGFATTRKRDSCLANLFFHTADEAAQVCQTDTVQLPKVETARNLGYGRWLITRRDDAYHMNILHQSTISSLTCKVCIITLDCGTELESDSLTLKSDRASCNATGAQRLDLQLDPPLYAFRTQLTAFADINTAHDQLQNQSSVFPKVEKPMLRPLQELKSVLPINQHVPKTSALPTLNNYAVLENLHIPTRQHFISTIIIALLVSLVVQVLFHYSPRIAAKARTWRAARAARKAKNADASSPHADTSSLTELHAPSATRLQHIQQPLSLSTTGGEHPATFASRSTRHHLCDRTTVICPTTTASSLQFAHNPTLTTSSRSVATLQLQRAHTSTRITPRLHRRTFSHTCIHFARHRTCLWPRLASLAYPYRPMLQLYDPFIPSILRRTP